MKVLFYSTLFVILGVPVIIQASTKPNIIFILTDDQDVMLNSMSSMINVNRLIGDEGVTLRNSFVNTPICCPSRSSILTGKYLHNTNVRNNSLSGNCSSLSWQDNHEPYAFPSLLKNKANYSTFYAGKYLNQYGRKECGGTEHVPPGYDWWLGLKGNSKYYNYTLSINGTAKEFTDEYLTDVMKTYALDFLNQKHIQEMPFFMMLSTPAAHAPFTAAPRHRNKFSNTTAIRNPSFNYSSDDKHWLIRMPPKYLPSDVTILDNIQMHRLQTLLAVDEMIEEITLKLKSIDVLENTYIVFTSDNGFHIGQFVQPWDKRQPYDTDIRVPLLIRGPNINPRSASNLPVSSIDLAPTILDMAGIHIPDSFDGQSFLEEISTSNEGFEERNILIEYFGEANRNDIDPKCPWVYDKNLTECTAETWCKCQDSRNNTYSCLRRISSTINFKFCEFNDDENFVEAYNLKTDPFELYNIYKELDSEEIKGLKEMLLQLKNCKGIECQY